MKRGARSESAAPSSARGPPRHIVLQKGTKVFILIQVRKRAADFEGTVKTSYETEYVDFV